MSRNYDNWERLVAAVLRREQFRQLCRCDSIESSFSSLSLSSDFSFSFSLSRRFSRDLSSNYQTGQFSSTSLVNFPLDPLPLPPKNPYGVGAHGNSSGTIAEASVSGASLVVPAPAKLFSWPRRRKPNHHLIRSFVTGIPKLMRSEIETACEDFSNIVIASSSNCVLYKGSLTNGTEISVASVGMESAKHWSNSKEGKFKKKIGDLSTVNHRNFVNILGYCSEEKPFSRMMVFEYAANGTLFEYLHIKEAERLDWATRLRIVMGIAYCLEYLHQLNPAVVHTNMNSSTVHLTEDYAAKLSDYGYWDELDTAETEEATAPSNVHSFGMILFEIVTGILPYSHEWLAYFPRGVRELIDPTLETYEEEQLEQIGAVIKSCANRDPRGRPTMKMVCAWLREITEIGPDGAIPKRPSHEEINIWENVVI